MIFPLIILFSISSVWSINYDSCNDHVTCDKCIRVPQCIWNLDKYANPKLSRCFSSTNYNDQAFNPRLLYSAENSMTITKDNPLDSDTLITPQRVELNLKHNAQYHFSISTRVVEGKTLELIHTTSKYVEVKLTPVSLPTKDEAIGSSGSHAINETLPEINWAKENYLVELKVTKCPSDPKNLNQIVIIHPLGVSNNLTLDIHLLCNCPCQQLPGYNVEAPECCGNGDLKCGVCECKQNFSGKNCQGSMEMKSPITSSCTPINSTEECSRRGICVCGNCRCEERLNREERIYGQYCECDNFSCDRYSGKLCGGPDHGSCNCGICECQVGWTGQACECTTLTSACYNPLQAEICSGNGSCDCGKCTCKAGFSGAFCESNI